MHELEPGSKISVLTSDEWVTGVFLGFHEEANQDWLIIDLGREKPRRINAGFVQEIEEHAQAEIKIFNKLKICFK